MIIITAATAGVPQIVTGSTTDTGAASISTTTITANVVGNDQALFDLGEATGVLSFKVPPSFESPSDTDGNNSCIIEVTASDGTDSVAQTLTVNVTEVDASNRYRPDQFFDS